MFQENFKVVSRILNAYFKEVSGVCHDYFIGVKKFQGCLMSVSQVVKEIFKEV